VVSSYGVRDVQRCLAQRPGGQGVDSQGQAWNHRHMAEPAASTRVIDAARTAFAKTGRISDAIAVLRESGCSPIESIKAVMDISGVDLKTAKSIVHYSTAYADQRAEHEAFHQALAEELGLDPPSVVVPPPPPEWRRT
jgi:ribosomal protein L7/L12